MLGHGTCLAKTLNLQLALLLTDRAPDRGMERDAAPPRDRERERRDEPPPRPRERERERERPAKGYRERDAATPRSVSLATQISVSLPCVKACAGSKCMHLWSSSFDLVPVRPNAFGSYHLSSTALVCCCNCILAVWMVGSLNMMGSVNRDCWMCCAETDHVTEIGRGSVKETGQVAIESVKEIHPHIGMTTGNMSSPCCVLC